MPVNHFHRPGARMLLFLEDLQVGDWCYQPDRGQWRTVGFPTELDVRAILSESHILPIEDKTMAIVQVPTETQPHLEGILRWGGAYLRMRLTGE